MAHWWAANGQQVCRGSTGESFISRAIRGGMPAAGSTVRLVSSQKTEGLLFNTVSVHETIKG